MISSIPGISFLEARQNFTKTISETIFILSLKAITDELISKKLISQSDIKFIKCNDVYYSSEPTYKYIQFNVNGKTFHILNAPNSIFYYLRVVTKYIIKNLIVKHLQSNKDRYSDYLSIAVSRSSAIFYNPGILVRFSNSGLKYYYNELNLINKLMTYTYNFDDLHEIMYFITDKTFDIINFQNTFYEPIISNTALFFSNANLVKERFIKHTSAFHDVTSLLNKIFINIVDTIKKTFKDISDDRATDLASKFLLSYMTAVLEISKRKYETLADIAHEVNHLAYNYGYFYSCFPSEFELNNTDKVNELLSNTDNQLQNTLNNLKVKLVTTHHRDINYNFDFEINTFLTHIGRKPFMFYTTTYPYSSIIAFTVPGKHLMFPVTANGIELLSRIYAKHIIEIIDIIIDFLNVIKQELEAYKNV